MKDPWKAIRTVSLTVILSGAFVIGGGTPEPAEASASSCFFCVSSCPSSPSAFCSQHGCGGSHAGCLNQDPCSTYKVDCTLL